MKRTAEHLHGGYVYGDDVRYDFSANLNPLGMPESVKKAAAAAIEYSDRYPDPFCGMLTEKLKGLWGVSGDRIVFGNGAADLIYRIVYAVRPRRAVIVTPTFTEYAQALKSVNCEITEHRLREDNGFKTDDSILEKLADGTDMLFLCDPNNPTGRFTDPELMKRIINACERGIYLVLDECFIELAENCEAHRIRASDLNRYTIILRAFTKTYAMAGLRLGYAVFGSPETALAVMRSGQHWSVSAPAQYAGLAALDEREYVEAARRLITRERAYLSSEIRKAGFTVYPSDADFILCRAENAGLALKLESRLRADGIAIRNCWNFAGLGEDYFRIAVRTHAENEELIKAVRRFTDWQKT